MFLCQPLLDVLIARGIEDVDSFIQAPSWSNLPDPHSIPGMTQAVERVLAAVREKQRIAIHGDYDCDGVLSTYILRSVLSSLGAQPRAHLPHRDEGYGLSSHAVHKFSQGGTDLLITVDNGINAEREVLLAKRLGIDVVVIDHHRIQEQADTVAVWSSEFCGAGLAALFAWALARHAGWNEKRLGRLLSAVSQYAAIASIADCVPLINGTRTLARLGMGEFARAEAARNEEAAQRSVEVLNQLNLQRRQLVAAQFEELCGEMPKPVPAGLVMYRESCPKGIAGLIAAKCVERFSVPSIVLAPAPTPGLAIGSGRSVAGFDLVEGLEQFRGLFTRFGGHAEAVGLTMPIAHLEIFAREFAAFVATLKLKGRREIQEDAELVLATAGKRFDEQLALLEPFGEGNPAPVFLLRAVEVVSTKNRWVRVRQGRYSLEALSWDLSPKQGAQGDCLVEFHGKRRILRDFREGGTVAPRSI